MPSKHGRRYPWDEWFQRKEVVLVKGRDYDCTSYGMAGMARNAACRPHRRIGLKIVVREDRVTIEVLGKLDSKEDKNARRSA